MTTSGSDFVSLASGSRCPPPSIKRPLYLPLTFATESKLTQLTKARPPALSSWCNPGAMEPSLPSNRPRILSSGHSSLPLSTHLPDIQGDSSGVLRLHLPQGPGAPVDATRQGESSFSPCPDTPIVSTAAVTAATPDVHGENASSEGYKHITPNRPADRAPVGTAVICRTTHPKVLKKVALNDLYLRLKADPYAMASLPPVRARLAVQGCAPHPDHAYVQPPPGYDPSWAVEFGNQREPDLPPYELPSTSIVPGGVKISKTSRQSEPLTPASVQSDQDLSRHAEGESEPDEYDQGYAQGREEIILLVSRGLHLSNELVALGTRYRDIAYEWLNHMFAAHPSDAALHTHNPQLSLSTADSGTMSVHL
ncbi:hypothetical protein CALCODRAFT_537512 [Calocera cornea HHB12733]|uniref:Uncharacterized protein n=1 Tax=Calocera cornea HHB12733 TaxID=1353952 RepID=A0A165K1G7_9BASI|nr:hypothetical protein CALCODRAFT_537512 [Calocera cornea HHB12733]